MIELLAADLRCAFPAMSGFSLRNLKYMRAFAEIYPDSQFVQQPVAQIPWGHHTHLLDRVKNVKEREFYLSKTLEYGWSRSILSYQIESKLYERQGKAITNFSKTLPPLQSDLAHQVLKDPLDKSKSRYFNRPFYFFCGLLDCCAIVTGFLSVFLVRTGFVF